MGIYSSSLSLGNPTGCFKQKLLFLTKLMICRTVHQSYFLDAMHLPHRQIFGLLHASLQK